jgi:DNA-binding CsgD family transcriptional regulator
MTCVKEKLLAPYGLRSLAPQDPEYRKTYLESFSLNPAITAGHVRPLGEVYTGAKIDREELFTSRFYHEWVKPQRLGDYVGINALRSGRRISALGANRRVGQPNYGEQELQLFRLLVPHICRTFAISQALDLKTVTSLVLEATLDALVTGVYLTDRSGRVVYMNSAAEHQIKTGNALRIINSRLAPVSHATRAAMSTAIVTAIADEAAKSTSGISLALPDSDKAGLVATVLPLDRGRRRGVSGPFAAAAAVFVQDPVVVPIYPGEAFAKLYGLTGAELRVLLAMAPGLGVKEAAVLLGIGEVTARTHLQHIFSKTGTSKQTELLNLLKNSTPPVRVA